VAARIFFVIIIACITSHLLLPQPNSTKLSLNCRSELISRVTEVQPHVVSSHAGPPLPRVLLGLRSDTVPRLTPAGFYVNYTAGRVTAGRKPLARWRRAGVSKRRLEPVRALGQSASEPQP